MSWFHSRMKDKGDRLKHQATHTDQFGALYKYVNGRLFHFRRHPYYHGMITLYVWGVINLPSDYEIFEIGKKK